MADNARRVFISFRFSDGIEYKNKLEDMFDSSTKVINCSEDEDRTGLSDASIRRYLYDKLAATSVTIMLLTPLALNYRRNGEEKIDDWTYDEVRYSLEDRTNNRTNGLVAVCAPGVWDMVAYQDGCMGCEKACQITAIPEREHLFRKNMLNVLPEFKRSNCPGIYNRLDDSYCTLVDWGDFCNNYGFYIDKASEKRDRVNEFKLVKRLD